MTDEEKMGKLKSLSDSISHYNIKDATKLLREANNAITIFKTFDISDNIKPPFEIELGAIIKQCGILEVSASHWTTLTKPKKNTVDRFTGIKKRIHNYIDEGIRLLEEP